VEGNDASFKYEDLYLRGYETVPQLLAGLGRYFAFYNEGRLHQSLGYRGPPHEWWTPS
jgi:putative transposase